MICNGKQLKFHICKIHHFAYKITHNPLQGGWSFTFSWWEGLRVSALLTVMSAGAQAPGRSNQTDKAKGKRAV
jgi:hypothetical protein